MSKALFLPIFIIVGLLVTFGMGAAALGIAIKSDSKDILSVNLAQTAPAHMHIVFTTTGESDWDEVGTADQLAFPPGSLRDIANQTIPDVGVLPLTLENIESSSSTVPEGSEGLYLPKVKVAGLYHVYFVTSHSFSGVQDDNMLKLAQYMWLNDSLKASSKAVLDLTTQPASKKYTLTTSSVVELKPTDKVYFSMTGTPSDSMSPSPGQDAFLHSIDRDPSQSYIRLEALPPRASIKTEVGTS